MIIRHWMDCPIVNNRRLREWRIFTRRQGDPPNAETGEVCFDFNCYGRAVVIPGVTTEPAVYEGEVESMCVASGEGHLVVEGQDFPIRAGSSFTVPAGIDHHFKNAGSVELELIFGRRPPASSDREFVLTHWTEDHVGTERGAFYQSHWNYIARGPVGEVHFGDIPPHKFGQPHNHIPAVDEIWYIQGGNCWHWMGQEFRPQSPGYALWLDPTELHALMNPGETNVEYIYCGSWALSRDRERQQKEEEALPGTSLEMVAALEKRFEGLFDAYRKTGLNIHGVDMNSPQIKRLIQALKEVC